MPITWAVIAVLRVKRLLNTFAIISTAWVWERNWRRNRSDG
jgi:hypothetical protein